MKIQALKGFKDVQARESYKWQYIESVMRRVTRVFGYREVRTPVLENTDLFLRSVGDTTDIVQKEMYTFTTKGDDSVTLKPEGTAGVVRQFVEHKEFANPQPTRMYYLNCPVFRYEQPQAGRLREHHQFGVELFGSGEAVADAEVIALAMQIASELGIQGLRLHINNIGCPECRPAYNKALRDHFAAHIDGMCTDCKSRLDKNPLRILDCKNQGCRAHVESAPQIVDYVCDGCREHFQSLQQFLTAAGIDFVVDARLVRGLDYYTRLVFEVISDSIGAQSTVCGGGRYDHLVEQVGGPSVPGIGFGMGMERLLLVMEGQGVTIPNEPSAALYIAHYGADAWRAAWTIATDLRKRGVSASMDTLGRSMKAQFKYADKLGVPFVAVIGDDEIASGTCKLRRMDDGTETEISLDGFAEAFASLV